MDYSTNLVRLPYVGKYLDQKNRITREEYRHYCAEARLLKAPLEEQIFWISSEQGSSNDYFTVDVVHEKMSKSKYNVVNPDDIVEKYGADTFRMYEMFLGPVEQSKPWDTKGIEGVHRFLRKFWRLFVDEVKGSIVSHEAATPVELKVLHKTIKKIEEDTERFSFNTAVSAFMVCVNELNDLKCHKKEILEPLVILLTPYAPHIAEELWALMQNDGSVLDAVYPRLEEKYLVESSKEYPVSINGKLRTTLNISLDASQHEVEQIVVANEVVQKWLDGKSPKKIIFVKGKMINVVM
jgi:leucyl-tRNA synthetase